MPHPLPTLLIGAARGTPPPADFTVTVCPKPPGMTEVVAAFTAHNVVAVDHDPDEILAHIDEGDPASPLSVPFLAWLAGATGAEIGVLDGVWATIADGAPPDVGLDAVEDGDDLLDHPRVFRASRHREGVRVFTDPHRRGVVVLGRGLGRRWEVAFEVDEPHRGDGLGRALVAGARSLLPEGTPIFAQASPGNTASVRSVIAAGYRPIGSEVLVTR